MHRIFLACRNCLLAAAIANAICMVRSMEASDGIFKQKPLCTSNMDNFFTKSLDPPMLVTPDLDFKRAEAAEDLRLNILKGSRFPHSLKDYAYTVDPQNGIIYYWSTLGVHEQRKTVKNKGGLVVEEHLGVRYNIIRYCELQQNWQDLYSI
jgi:hypothetical protein